MRVSHFAVMLALSLASTSAAATDAPKAEEGKQPASGQGQQPATESSPKSYRDSLSLGVVAAPYVLTAVDELRFRTFVGLAVQPEVRYSVKVRGDTKAFVTARWTGLANLSTEKVSASSAARTTQTEALLGMGMSVPIGKESGEGLTSSVKRLSLCLGYGNFKMADNNFVQGIALMLSLDADVVAFGIDWGESASK